MKTPSPSPTWRIARPDVTFDFLEGEVIAIHLPSGFYFSLRETAAFLWQALDAGWDIPRMATRLASSPGAPADVMPDLTAFFEMLASNQLVLPVDSPEPGNTASVPEPAAYAKPVLEKYADLQELLLLDPIHEVSDEGWPHTKH